MSVTLEVSKLSGWLNGELCRESKEGHMRCGVRYTGQGQQALDDRGASGVQGWAGLYIGGRARGGARTWNMAYMAVTLEVSQLEMSASKLCKFWKSPLMSVTLETSQSAIWPYFPIAAGLSLLNSVTAAFSEVLVVKVAGQVPRPQLEP